MISPLKNHTAKILLISLMCIIASAINAQQTQTFSTAGAHTFTVPAGVFSITVEAWGAGGGGGFSSGNKAAGGGGGGGGYTRRIVNVSPGEIININVGQGGNGGNPIGSNVATKGGNTWFRNESFLVANGGERGFSTSSNNTGATGGAGGTGGSYNGGSGASGLSYSYGGGGGSSAGTSSNGYNSTNKDGGVAAIGGGAGGNGGDNSNGMNGSTPGGGGGGGQSNNNSSSAGGNGGNGQIKLSWTISELLSPIGVITNASCPNNADGVIKTNTPIEFHRADEDYIDLGAPLLSNLTQFTIEGWIKFNISDISGTRWAGLFGQNDAIEFGIMSATELQCWTPNGGSVSINPSSIGDNNWHHIAAVGNGSDIRLYIDGALVATGGQAISNSNYGSSGFSTKIGGQIIDPTGGIFPGQIRKTGFWNIALSSLHIATIGAYDYFYSGLEAGLIAGFNYLDGEGSTLTNILGGSNGTLINSPIWKTYSNYSWSKTGTPTFSSTDRNLNNISTGEYILTITDGGNTAQNTFIVLSDDNCANYWVGSISNEWNNISNWSSGYIPKSGKDVIFATTNNFTIAAIRDLILDQDRVIGNLINLSERNLIIPANKSLEIKENITTNNHPDRIQIKASSDGTLPNGSLIFKEEKNAVYATVEMYSKAFKNDAAINNKYKWQYFTIPVRSTTASPTHDGSWVRRWDETGTSVTNHWVALDNQSVMSSFTGYEITHNAPKVIVYKGMIENRDFNRSLDYTANALYPGQHIFGNPYTAAIDIKKLTFSGGAEEAVYLYNTGSYDDWESNNGESISGDLPGQYTVVPRNQAGTGGIPAEIPSMQGFLVKAKGPTPAAQIGITYSAVITKNTTTQRIPASKIKKSDKTYLRIDVKGDKSADRMWLFTQAGTSHQFDNGWDGYKMMGESSVPQLFATGKDGYYQVSTSHNIDETYIGFKAGDDLQYTLFFSHENLEKSYSKVILIDLAENKSVDILNSNSGYTFYVNNNNLDAKRFKIITEEKDIQLLVKIRTTEKTIFIENNTLRNGEMYVYDMTGRILHAAPIQANTTSQLTIDAPKGAYLVKSVFEQQSFSEKIMLY